MHVSVKVIRDLKNGSEKAFDKVYFEYHKYIYYIIYAYIKDIEQTKDLTQEAFIKMYQDIKSLKDLDAFHQWFITIAKNLSKDYLRKVVRTDEMLSHKSYELLNAARTSPSPEGLNFENLNDMELNILNLKIVFNRSFKEIAETLDLSFDVTTKMYYKAVAKLKKELEVR